MTVEELIEELKKYDVNKKVYMVSQKGDMYDSDFVTKDVDGGIIIYCD